MIKVSGVSIVPAQIERGRAQNLAAFGRYFAQNAHGQAGAGEGLAHDDFLRQAQFQAKLAHLILEQAAQRLDQLEFHVLGQTADVVMTLD